MYAKEAALPAYRDRFLFAAAELEDRAQLLATVVRDQRPNEADRARLHRPINILV